MCGIAGIFSTPNSLDNESMANKLAAMKQALQHRGPDDSGSFFSPGGSAAFCHTRLSIIDLSSAGRQPMHSNDARYSITFNGEIYNYQTLRQELEDNGEAFNSNSDTEVLLRLYQRHGTACLTRLRGMFAFAIWDEQEQRGFAARDPLGIKPFYFTANQETLAFASEVRTLLNARLHSNTLSSQGFSSYFLSGSLAEPATLLEDIKQLPAGCSLEWQAGQSQVQQYWDFNFSAEPTSHQQAIKKTRDALESTIKAHFVSDVPVGIFLSGGIDSTALVALATQLTDTRINTYSIAFESPEWNEGDIAKRVAEHFGTQHTEFLMTPDIAKPLFEEFLKSVDQPSIDGFNTFCVSKLASEQGEKVVLSGVGGDELFAGYKSFEMLPKMSRIAKRLGLLSPLFSIVNRLFARVLPSKLQRSLDFMQRPHSLSAAHQSLRGIFSERESRCLSKAYGVRAPYTPKPEQTGTLADQISQLELSRYMRNQLLRDSDTYSMAWGLELRVPFVDRELIENIASIPAEIRLRQGKQLLIEAVPELPDWVVNRPKQGFRFPFDEWFKAQWSGLPQPKGLPSWITLTPWYRRWSLLILNDWLKRYVD